MEVNKSVVDKIQTKRHGLYMFGEWMPVNLQKKLVKSAQKDNKERIKEEERKKTKKILDWWYTRMIETLRKTRGWIERLGGWKSENASALRTIIDTFKFHVSCIDGKISVRIIYFYYLFLHRRPTHKLCFIYCRPFVVNVTFFTGIVVSSVSRNYKTC